MLRAAVVVGLASALLLCVSFAFFFTDITFVVALSGERVIVCKLPAKVDEPTDRYAIGLANLLGRISGRKVRFEHPTSTYEGVTVIDEAPLLKLAPRPSATGSPGK